MVMARGGFGSTLAREIDRERERLPGLFELVEVDALERFLERARPRFEPGLALLLLIVLLAGRFELDELRAVDRFQRVEVDRQDLLPLRTLLDRLALAQEVDHRPALRVADVDDRR